MSSKCVQQEDKYGDEEKDIAALTLDMAGRKTLDGPLERWELGCKFPYQLSLPGIPTDTVRPSTSTCTQDHADSSPWRGHVFMFRVRDVGLEPCKEAGCNSR